MPEPDAAVARPRPLARRTVRLSTAGLVIAGMLSLAGCADVAAALREDWRSPSAPASPSATRDRPDAAIAEVAPPCVSAGPLDLDDPNVAQTLDVAMAEDEFWELIDVLGGRSAHSDFARLIGALEDRPAEDLVSFNARLTLALYALDDECHLRAYEEDDPSGIGFVSSDVFLYARADTVTAGREYWEEAIAGGRLPWGDVTPGAGEALLFAALDASRTHGMDEYELWNLEDEAFALSYESGSNPDGW